MLSFFVVTIVRPMASRCRSEDVGMVHGTLRASVRSKEWNTLLSDFSFFHRFPSSVMCLKLQGCVITLACAVVLSTCLVFCFKRRYH